MKNPFSFSGIVEDPAFCNREKEQTDLTRFIGNSQNVLLYSHRRFGKTSLINRVFKDFTSGNLKHVRVIQLLSAFCDVDMIGGQQHNSYLNKYI